MKLRHIPSILIALAAIFPTACGNSHSGHDHSGHDHNEEAEHAKEHDGGEKKDHKHEGEISLSHEAEELAGLRVETVKDSAFSSVIKTGGRIEAPQGAQATVSARISGIVSFTNKNLAVGNSVGAGQSLFTVSARGLEQSDGKSAAKISLGLAEKELARAEELIKDNLISKKEYEQIKHDYAVAKANAEGVSIKGASSSIGASSPIAGYVTSILVNQGQFVNQGDPLATVSQTRRLHLRADVSERQWNRIGDISGARVIVPGIGDEAMNLTKLNFRVVSRDMPDVSTSHYIPVYMEFDNPGVLRNGSVAEIYLLGQKRDNVISVPIEAVTEEQGHDYVYVRLHPHAFKRVPVETGESDGLRIEIKSGLKQGDEVVVKGVHSVRLAENSGIVPQGHSHNH